MARAARWMLQRRKRGASGAPGAGEENGRNAGTQGGRRQEAGGRRRASPSHRGSPSVPALVLGDNAAPFNPIGHKRSVLTRRGNHRPPPRLEEEEPLKTQEQRRPLGETGAT
ncbi:hypothetical protein EYF80_027353 [Liparis tanakae]|uniref:Uncharacterized protein n=1 Tax=Liparis tanakae TaxID=230148 RepID=A0A4Z2HB04_9TELE|nr:hypothetical protein EYF80_027353 [Liparis tanakae]